LLLLALSYRYWRRAARVQHAGKWLALLPVLFAAVGGLTAKTACCRCRFRAAAGADRGAAR
jgi:NitT/TauT family transport system permease protein